MEALAKHLKNAKEQLKQVKHDIAQLTAEIPNLPAKGTPVGQDESYNSS